MQILLKNGLVVLDDNGVCRLTTTNVLVKNGYIEAIGDQIEGSGDQETRVIDLTGKMVLPGLINAHSHSYANMVKSMGEALPLEQWMYYAMLVGKMSLDQLRVAASLQVIENLRKGNTAFVDHLARDYAGLDTAMEVYAKTGVRAALAPMISDLGYTETLPSPKGDAEKNVTGASAEKLEEILDECEALIKKWHGHEGRLSVMIGPSGPQRCSDQLLQRSYELALKYNVGYHTHLLETHIQAQTAIAFWGKTMVEHLAELELLSPQTSLAHGVWLTDEDKEIVAKTGASVVHNPMSNLALGSGVAPLGKYIAAGVNIALGSDGSNCGGTQSIIKSMQLAAVLTRLANPDYSTWLTAEKVFRMGTLGGAKVLGMEDKLGSISVGKIADLVAIDLNQTIYQPLHDPIAQLVYGETGQGVELVMVAGQILLEDGRLTTIDEEAVLKEARDMAASLAKTRDEWLAANQDNYRYVDEVYRGHWKL